MDESAQPVWARADAFPEKPESAPYGLRELRGRNHDFEEIAGLKDFIAAGKGRLGWVWTPDHDRLVAPEEVPALEKALLKRRVLLASDDQETGRRGLVVFGLVLAWALYAAWRNQGWSGVSQSPAVGLSAILFLIFGLKPWWDSRLTFAEVSAAEPGSLLHEVPEARFELWLTRQRVWLTPGLVVLVGLVFLVQLTDPQAIWKAGIDKVAYHAGQRWRLLTGPFLHGNWLHLLMNGSALWYLGRRTEILARWPHLAAVFFFSLIGAGWATVTLLPQIPSVGISGAVSGLLGFLLVFEILHRQLVPTPARRNLFAMLVLMGVIGALGFRFIDNAAHAGGLVTGAVYAAVVFPKSSSPHRPEILGRDRVLGGMAVVLTVLSAVLAMGVILAAQ